MGLRGKFNLVLLLVFSFGLAATGWFTFLLLQQHAKEEVSENAGVMMAAASAIRHYTVSQIKPHMELQLMREFRPQTVPAYAATEVFNIVREKSPDKYGEYHYKEATLNPTNLRDKATPWEAEIVEQFRANKLLQELSGVRQTDAGQALYLARPIEIKDSNCLTCHSTPAAAPPTQIKLYGEDAGFGWKLGEIIGAQIVSVPMSLPIKKANATFRVFMISIAGVLLVVFVVLNFMLRTVVLRPVTRLSKIADQVSLGKFDIPEFKLTGSDEISVLASSFNRMRRSLEKAMKMLDG